MCFPAEFLLDEYREVGVEADILSHSYPVSISIDNPDHKLLPGMICKAYIGISHNKGIIIPFKSVQMDNNNRYYVWVVKNGVARRKSISICDEMKMESTSRADCLPERN